VAAGHDAAIAALGGFGAAVLTGALDLARDGIRARREDRMRREMAEHAQNEGRLRHLEDTVVQLRDDVAGLTGLVSGTMRRNPRRQEQDR